MQSLQLCIPSSRGAPEHGAVSGVQLRLHQVRDQRRCSPALPSLRCYLKPRRVTGTSKEELDHPRVCPPGPGCASACTYRTLWQLPERTTVIETAENSCWQGSPYLEQTSFCASHGWCSTVWAWLARRTNHPPSFQRGWQEPQRGLWLKPLPDSTKGPSPAGAALPT